MSASWSPPEASRNPRGPAEEPDGCLLAFEIVGWVMAFVVAGFVSLAMMILDELGCSNGLGAYPDEECVAERRWRQAIPFAAVGLIAAVRLSVGALVHRYERRARDRWLSERRGARGGGR